MLGESKDKNMIAVTRKTLQEHVASIILTAHVVTNKLGMEISNGLAYELAGESIDTMISIEKRKGEYYEYQGD